MFAALCKGLKVTQSFSPVIEHIEIMHHIERQLTRSQQGWVDNLAKTLWIHRTLPKNSQKETPFSLTYSSEVVIPIIKTTDDRRRVQKATKGKESKEVASIEKAYYRNKLQKYHSARSSHPMYIVGDFILLKRSMNEWQGPYIIKEVHKEELYKIVDTTDHSLAAHEPSLIKRIKESDLSPLKTSNMRKTNQVPKGNLLLKVAQYICPQLKATHEPSMIKNIKESDLNGDGFTRSVGGDTGFEDGVEDGVAFWEEGTDIWVLEGAGFCNMGGLFDNRASIGAAASATNSSSQGNVVVAKCWD
ncbi:reverse transcriptase domain-containing protein [Tanacetum coccineum]